MQTALNDLDGAIKFLIDAQDKHPNRNDIIAAINSTGKVADPVNPILNTTGPPSAGAFGAPQNNNAFGSTPAASNAFGGGGAFGKPAFGAPSAPASTPAFGKPAFGAPSAPASTGAFGQPSSLGAKPNPFGGGGSSAFGQPSSLGAGGGFGQPSALGQKPNPFAAATSVPFGQTPTTAAAAPSGFSAFAGGANGFSSGTPAANPFVQNSTPAFGQPQPPTGPSAMNGNAFGKPTNGFGLPSPPAAPTGPASNANPFAKSTAGFGQPAQTPVASMSQTPAFGQPSGGFGQPSGGFGQPSGGGFGQPSGGFGQPSGGFGQPSGGFGQPSQPQNPLTNGNTFGASSNPFATNNQAHSQQSQSQPQNPFQNNQNQQQQQQPSQNRPTTSTPGNPYPPNAKHTHPPLTSYTSHNAQNQLTMFKGHQVQFNPTAQQYEYRNRDGSIGKVLFPDGPPGYYGCTEEKDEVYDRDERESGSLKRVYEKLRENSGVGFEGGVMPLVAPRREWCLWDF